MRTYRVEYRVGNSRDTNEIDQMAYSKDRARIVAKKKLYDQGVKDVEIVKVRTYKRDERHDWRMT